MEERALDYEVGDSDAGYSHQAGSNEPLLFTLGMYETISPLPNGGIRVPLM